MLSIILYILLYGLASSNDFECDLSLVGKTRLVDAQPNISYAEIPKESMTGRVEVCLQDETSSDDPIVSYIWGTICGRRLTYETSNSLCASLYYKEFGTIKSVFRPKIVAETFDRAPEDQPSFFNNLDCGENSDTKDLTECEWDDEFSCSHLTDVYVECGERLLCSACDADTFSCTYDKVSVTTQRCTSSEEYCVRHVVDKSGTSNHAHDITDIMSCSAVTCEDLLEECGEGSKCMCNNCQQDTCNEMFLELFEINTEQVLDPLVHGFTGMMEILTFGIRIVLFDVVAWAELFS